VLLAALEVLVLAPRQAQQDRRNVLVFDEDPAAQIVPRAEPMIAVPRPIVRVGEEDLLVDAGDDLYTLPDVHERRRRLEGNRRRPHFDPHLRQRRGRDQPDDDREQDDSHGRSFST
jgi:hypothetical protein